MRNGPVVHAHFESYPEADWDFRLPLKPVSLLLYIFFPYDKDKVFFNESILHWDLVLVKDEKLPEW